MVMLGNWQLSRAQEKEARQEQLNRLSQQPVISLPTTLIKLEDYQFRKVEVHGTYVPSHTIYLDNKINQGRAGYQVITPVKLGESSMHVLINRGWVAAGRTRSELPNIPTPSSRITVSGIANSPTMRTLELSTETVSGQVWENLHLDRYRKTTGLTLQPLVILQENDVKDGLVRQWSRPDSGASRNLGYAFQWFSMALAVLILYLVLSVKRDPPKNE
ncbi:MAG: SURF1 family protein [Nitrosomonadales bacterium]|nr:MAG: SURF1 family protein [Nitrosomonadales bacterium]